MSSGEYLNKTVEICVEKFKNFLPPNGGKQTNKKIFYLTYLLTINNLFIYLIRNIL